MSDYISREDALLCATGEYADDSFEDSIRESECKKIAKRLYELKPADVRENIHGKWKRTYLDHVAMGERPSILYCFVCCQCIAYPTNFCPNCGADMRKEK